MSFQLMQRTAVTVLAAGFVFGTLAPAAHAQAIVRGILYDDAKGTPVRGTVMLVDPATDAAVAHTVSDSLGMFSLQIGNGTYQLAAVRPGYKSVLSAPIPLVSGERLTVRVPIAESGDPQHHIGVLEHVRPGAEAVKSAEAMKAQEMGGFVSRKRLGSGMHYDRKSIEKSPFHTLGEFLQNVPGLQVLDPGSTSSMSMARNQSSLIGAGIGGAGAPCRVGWFMDGHRMDIPGRSDPLTEGLGSLNLDAVEAVEVFRGAAEMPPEFSAADLRCGAIAVWTRRG